MTTLVGRTLGDYKLITTMGTGALGETFRAESVRGPSRGAVIKVMHAHLASDPTFAERFKREVSTAAGLRHPHIIGIEDFGQQQGQFYIVMELLTDGSLRTLLQKRDQMLPLRRGVALARDVADGLAFAHANRVLHRDMKPENVLVRLSDTDRDTAKLADVGLTRLTESGVTVGGNMMLGSFAYMSPEQCRGLNVDARSDIYSFGIVLYEIATGYTPFQVRTLNDALSKHTSATPPPPRGMNKQLPEALEQIILRCLAKDAASRWQSASEVMRALDAVLTTLPAGPVVRMQEHREPVRDQGPVVVMHDVGKPSPNPVHGRQAEPPSVRPTPGRYRVEMDEPLSTSAAGVTPTPSVDPDRMKVSLDAERRLRPTIPEEPKGGTPKATPSGDSRRIRVALDKQSLTINPGQPVVFSVTLNNSGRTVDHFTVSAEGVPGGWVKVPPQGAQLNPGQRTTVPLTVLAPRSPDAVAGDYPVVIRARSRENSGDSGSAAATWTVQPFAQSALTLAPSRARGWRRGRFRATLRNLGNTVSRYSLSGADEEQRLRWEFGQPQVPLDPGQSATVRVAAAAPLRLIGSPELRAFTVRVEGASAAAGLAPEPPLQAHGQFVHRALIPTWLPPLLILAGLAAWYLLRDRTQLQIAVQPPSAIVAIGATTTLSAAVTNEKNEAAPNQPISWSSRDSTIAAVTDSGVVVGRREGTTLIVVRSGTRSATAQISVVPPRVETVTLAPKALSLKIGASGTLRALARDANGVILRRDFAWQSSDPTVVTVGGNGRVTAKGPGSATITAQTEAKTATADITVAELPPGQTAEGTEDCVNYDPAPLKVASDKSAGWVLTDGSTNLLTLDNASDAQQALALARRYKSHCFLGRGNTRPNRSDYIIEYWAAPTRAPTVIDAEDCVRYDAGTLRIGEAGAQGFVLTDGRARLLYADTQKDAQKAWDIAQKHTLLCFIGRGNRRVNQRDYIVQYWK